MIRKPFRPPTVMRSSSGSINLKENNDGQPPSKKRRVSTEDAAKLHEAIQIQVKPLPSVTTARRPLLPVRNSATSEPHSNSTSFENDQYYTVLWRKFSMKKHKTWDGDGVLFVSAGYAHLQDISGQIFGKTTCTKPLLPGSTLSVGGREVEVDCMISKEDFLAGKQFLGKAPHAEGKETSNVPTSKTTNSKEHGKKQPNSGIRRTPSIDGLLSSVPSRSNAKAQYREAKTAAKQAEPRPAPVNQSKATNGEFKNPLLNKQEPLQMQSSNNSIPRPRHDPNLHHSLVMRRPHSCPTGKQIVDVVVDPILSTHLRDHQRDGVKFLYECAMGMRSAGEGAILADEMGLGKTLQTITLLWTLLKQNPLYQEAPVVKKALIVCPAGLTGNWRREFRKWLGNERIGVFVADNKKNRFTDFTMGKAYNVMIIGYELLRNVQEELKRGACIDIVIADEGHRLKTANNKAMLAIQSLNTERRIILSGTPLQNDLSEFYTAIDFVNPGLLGKRATFKREFEGPIVKSRQPEANRKEREKGEARWQELVSLTSQFMIRRTADVLAKYLPPKTEHVLFCKPTEAQASAYKNILSSPIFTAALGNTETALQLINVLKKVCNSPSLLNPKSADDTPTEMLTSILAVIPRNVLSSHASSAKIRVLDSLLHQIHTTTREKVVIVSNYTSTLDMIERLLTSLSYSFLRMDGATPATKRQPLVERFNKSDAKTAFAFLLSAKAGGVGLNLIGASRLVLFDLDWNPSTDLQAMARIHRDGQKLPCKIYRLLVQGALDEKIFQRQVTKQGLADAVVDNKASAASFSRDELRDLFRLDQRDACQTHDLLECACEGKGNIVSDSGSTITPEVNTVSEAEELGDALPRLLKASQVNMQEQEKKLSEQKRRSVDEKPKLGALMQYHHLDTRLLSSTLNGQDDEMLEQQAQLAALLDDDVLLEVLQEQDRRVNFVFSKQLSSFL